jgi:hypothetical protein
MRVCKVKSYLFVGILSCDRADPSERLLSKEKNSTGDRISPGSESHTLGALPAAGPVAAGAGAGPAGSACSSPELPQSQ